MKSKLYSRFKWLLPLCFLFTAYSASLQGATETSPPVQAHLLSEENSVQPGRPFWVGVELKMDAGWDTYWRNPGDAGFPTEVHWKLPDGFEAGPLQWPFPEKITNQSMVVFGYSHSVVLLSKITPPKNLVEGKAIEISADVQWLACKESCIPGNAHVTLSLPVKQALPLKNAEMSALFATAQKSVPVALTQTEGDLSMQLQKDQVVLNFKPKPGGFGEIENLLFIPEDKEVIDYAAPQNVEKLKDGLVLHIKKSHPDQEISSLKGVLIISEKGDVKRAVHIDSQSSSIKSTGTQFQGAFLFAFLGGMILNVMPCVLPVIALKIFGFVKMADQKRGLVVKHGIFFALGVLVSFWVLSSILLLLRASGEVIGWGFHLQEPIFVAILAFVVFLLGLSLFGVFEMGTSLISLGQKRGGSPLMSTFMSGVLATVVATPCTGPLLGPALGFAMALPAAKSLLIFTSIGLGMAFPYMIFSIFPSLVKYLPKPGNWMHTFKQLMGFLMMATVIWLIWVFGAQTDQITTFILLGALLIMAVGAWIFGKWATPIRTRATRIITTVVAGILILSSSGGALMFAKGHHESAPVVALQTVGDHQTQNWEPFSPERVQNLRAQGTPVFVDFTAKWCLICQTNKVTLRSAAVTALFQEKGIVTLTADWTKKDPVITKELEKLGRSGVPVYVLYPANPHETPQILPQTLSEKVLHSYLDKMDASKKVVHVD